MFNCDLSFSTDEIFLFDNLFDFNKSNYIIDNFYLLKLEKIKNIFNNKKNKINETLVRQGWSCENIKIYENINLFTINDILKLNKKIIKYEKAILCKSDDSINLNFSLVCHKKREVPQKAEGPRLAPAVDSLKNVDKYNILNNITKIRNFIYSIIVFFEIKWESKNYGNEN